MNMSCQLASELSLHMLAIDPEVCQAAACNAFDSPLPSIRYSLHLSCMPAAVHLAEVGSILVQKKKLAECPSAFSATTGFLCIARRTRAEA